jgi:hypothetical protein
MQQPDWQDCYAWVMTMRKYRSLIHLLSLLLLVYGAAVFSPLASAAAAEEIAVVAEGKINVRGKPSFVGEVITQLERGDKVTVLERITNSISKAGEPTNWAKIKLPQNTPVWVFSPFVKDGAVAATRLNLRAGPGENYSVIGRLSRGDAVKPIRTVEEWMEIEAPADSYAFIDLGLVQFEGGTNAPTAIAAIPKTEPPPREPERIEPVETQPAPAPPASATPVDTNTTVAAVPPTPRPAEPVAPEETIRSETAAPPTNVVSTPTEAPVQEPPPIAPSIPRELPKVAEPVVRKTGEPAPKRIVRREGIIRPTKSIQAPTWYELAHAQTGKTINYLYEAKLGLKLKDYRGQKVVVSGEEALDPRWPNTPILDLQTLDVLP